MGSSRSGSLAIVALGLTMQLVKHVGDFIKRHPSALSILCVVVSQSSRKQELLCDKVMTDWQTGCAMQS